jgi:hypothetical protein
VSMQVSPDQIVQMAEKVVAETGCSEEALFAAMGLIGNDAAMATFAVAQGRISLDASEMAARGRALFAKFETFLRQAVCQDFGYCAKRAQVDASLKPYLPEIAKYVLASIPVSDTLPGWLAPVLAVTGISAASLDVLIGFLVAWLITMGCNALCACPTS